MYLQGKKFLFTDWENPENNLHEDGFRVREKTLELGYWRKHPNLHGYIVNTFNEGDDNCEPIDLSVEDLQKIIAAIKAKELPETTGFFFGASDGSEDEESIETLEKALAWLETKESRVSRSVEYRASW